jgi:hypothetical protein
MYKFEIEIEIEIETEIETETRNSVSLHVEKVSTGTKIVTHQELSRISAELTITSETLSSLARITTKNVNSLDETETFFSFDMSRKSQQDNIFVKTRLDMSKSWSRLGLVSVSSKSRLSLISVSSQSRLSLV